MKKPWQKISSQIVHKNPWWQVKADKVICPNRQPGIYYVADLPDFVSIVAIDDNCQSIYLIRQWRYPIDQNSWETSQGSINPKEKPLSAAKRELNEETGLTAKKWRKIGFSYLANGFCNQAFHIYLAGDLKAGRQKLEGTELDMIVKKISLKKVEQMIAQGAITDSPTIVSFYYLKQYLKK
ncbi:MAG: NUDIX hydrolase [Candidatus Buchananbacteria bacterium]